MLTNRDNMMPVRPLADLTKESEATMEKETQLAIERNRQYHEARCRKAEIVQKALAALDAIPEEIPVRWAGNYHLDIELGTFTRRPTDRARLSRLLVAMRKALGSALKWVSNDLDDDGKHIVVTLRQADSEQAVTIRYNVPVPRKGKDGKKPKCRVVKRVYRTLVCDA